VHLLAEARAGVTANKVGSIQAIDKEPPCFLTRSDGFIVRDKDREVVRPGERVGFLPIPS